MPLGLSLASCCTPCNAIIHVIGCPDPYGVGIPIEGATVSYTQGDFTSPTYTTDSSGDVTITVHTFGDAVFTVVPPIGAAHHVTRVVTLNLRCPNTGYTIGLGLEDGWDCHDDGCCPTGGEPPYPVHTYPTTVYLSDGVGIVMMTCSLLGGGGADIAAGYSGSATRSTVQSYSVVTEDGSTGCALGVGGSVTVYFGLACAFLGAPWKLTVVMTGGCRVGASPNLFPGPDASLFGINRTVPGALSFCPPTFTFSATESFGGDPGTPGFGAAQVYPSGVTFTVTQ